MIFHSTFGHYQSERISLFIPIYFETINHQDNSWPLAFYRVVLSIKRGSCTFQSKARRQISVPVFQLIQKLSLPLKFWQNYLIDWAEKGRRGSWWTAASKKVNLISSDCCSSGNLFQNTWTSTCQSKLYSSGGRIGKVKKVLFLWHFLDNLMSNAKKVFQGIRIKTEVIGMMN